MEIIKPPRLRKGDVIGLISPASTPQPEEKVEGAIRYLEGLGYRIRLGEHSQAVRGYLAGRDEERVSDLNAMIRDPQVKAILALRGGYGTPRILPEVDYTELRRQPKIVAGFSDITALQLAIFRKSRLVTFSSPMPAVELWEGADPFTEECFWRMLTSPKRQKLMNPDGELHLCARKGKAEGVLLGGNLALLVSQLATPYCPSFKQSLLFLEEVDEFPYRVDRMFVQLRNAGILGQISGLVLGQFTRCDPQDKRKPSLTIGEVIKDAIGWSCGPVMENFLYGHVPRKVTLPIGAMGRMDAGKGTITLLESVVE